MTRNELGHAGRGVEESWAQRNSSDGGKEWSLCPLRAASARYMGQSEAAQASEAIGDAIVKIVRNNTRSFIVFRPLT